MAQPISTNSPQMHYFEYAKTSKGKCHGPKPCKGSEIFQGSLRYGEAAFDQKKNEVYPLWRHWGCVSPEIIARLSAVKLTQTGGWGKLLPGDRSKVKTAVKSGRIAESDKSAALKRLDWSELESTARVAPPPSAATTPAPSQRAPAAGPSALSPMNPSAKRKLDPPPATMPAATQGGQPFRDDEDIYASGPDDSIADELYVILPTQVVGIQYYRGLVGAGENVMLEREPSNPYDRNAIRVLNFRHTQVGHLPRTVASRLAPLMDKKMVTVEGNMTESHLTTKKVYNLNISLKIFGPSYMRPQLEAALAWATPGQRGFTDNLRSQMAYSTTFDTPNFSQMGGAAAGMGMGMGMGMGAGMGGMAGMASGMASAMANALGMGAGSMPIPLPIPTSSQMPKGYDPEAARAAMQAQMEARARAAELAAMLNTLEKVDDAGRRDSALDSICINDNVLELPAHKNPPGVATGELNTDLLKHQLQALQWCYEHEYPELPKKEGDKPVQFWTYKKDQSGKPYYFNIATKTPQVAKPILGKGALVADAMGLGKTLTMLSLIIGTMKDTSPDYSRATLIVAPLSVLSNWVHQIKEHTTEGLLHVHTYYDKGRNIHPSKLEKFDVVITTYETVTGDWKRAGLKPELDAPVPKKPKLDDNLFGVKWKRVVLDEGHQIRNPKTIVAQAVCRLEADRRWILTGTPIINSARDLGSILTFLRICSPLDDGEYFKSLILRPVTKGQTEGAELLKVLMSHICLRRTKEMEDAEGNRLIPLPPVDVTKIPVALHKKARELYDAVEEVTGQRIRELANSHSGPAAGQANILSMLTRLRQITLHPGLVPSDYLDNLRAQSGALEGVAAPSLTQISPKEKHRLQTILARTMDQMEDCPICFDTLREPRITTCSHVFCLPCITEAISRDPKCPMDRRPISCQHLIEPLPQEKFDATQTPLINLDEELEMDESDEPSAKIDQLMKLLSLLPRSEKSLIFSSFTSFLDMVAARLAGAGIRFVRFDGRMKARERDAAIAEFMVPLSCADDGTANTEDILELLRQDNENDSDEDEDEAETEEAPTAATPAEETSTRPRRNATRTATQNAALDLSSDEDIVSFKPAKGKGKTTAKKRVDSDDEDFVESPTKSAGKSSDFRMSDASSDEDIMSFNLTQATAANRAKRAAKAAKAAKRAETRANILGKAKKRRDEMDIDSDEENMENYGNPVVMLCSLKAAALGLNLTVANNVFLLDPWWQESIESQAIDRCNRIGQKKPVHVWQMIADDTIESRVLEIQDKKKMLIKQAFSGTKAVETERQKREARLADLIALFKPRKDKEREAREKQKGKGKEKRVFNAVSTP